MGIAGPRSTEERLTKLEESALTKEKFIALLNSDKLFRDAVKKALDDGELLRRLGAAGIRL